jgi:hypothetical protein
MFIWHGLTHSFVAEATAAPASFVRRRRPEPGDKRTVTRTTGATLDRTESLCAHRPAAFASQYVIDPALG